MRICQTLNRNEHVSSTDNIAAETIAESEQYKQKLAETIEELTKIAQKQRNS